MIGSFSVEPEASEQEPINESRSVQGPRFQEIVAILAIVLLADFTIYRGHGFTGLAVFFLGALWLLYFGKPRRQIHPSLLIIGGMMALLAARLLWFGSPLQVVLGFALVSTFATALDGQKPFLLAVLAMALQTILCGCRVLAEYLSVLRHISPHIPRRGILNIVLPALAFALFSGLFILANPNVVSFVGRQLDPLLNALSEWIVRVVSRPMEFLFWIAVAWITAGLLRPTLRLASMNLFARGEEQRKPANAPLYSACRNTLVTVIGLFAVYLAYEYYTLWTRVFPEGFYYAGFAHQGAAWLTIALALATLILSLVFSGHVRDDLRLPKLRLLAWVWSLQNILLSMAVYNRLFIYIDFNGMTWMRIVGLFGTSVVVVGFLLVVWKIAFGKDFPWLIHRQAWALAMAVYLFALTPVDGIAVAYNVRRILSGDLSASMQIGVHRQDLEGTLSMQPLLDCSTPEIQEGVAALIAEQYLQLHAAHDMRQRKGWTAHQFSDRIALRRFETVREKWSPYEDANRRAAAIERFYDFSYQWY